MTQSMSFSPYKKPFEERIAKWEQQLNLVSARGGVLCLRSLPACVSSLARRCG